MKKTLLIAVFGAVMAMSSVFAQHTQSLAFTGPAVWNPGTTITLGVDLTFNGYSSEDLDYWLEVPNALAPFLQVNMPTYHVFSVANSGGPWPATWSNIGARSGYMSEDNTLGGGTPLSALIAPGTDHVADIIIPPGTYHIADIPISVLAGAIGSPGTYTLFSTTNLPRNSSVYDLPDYNENNIPAAPFVFTIVPEPSTLALLGLTAVGSLVVIRRRKAEAQP